jgi:hypothetical protein
MAIYLFLGESGCGSRDAEMQYGITGSVFGPPGYGYGSISQRYGSGSGSTPNVMDPQH